MIMYICSNRPVKLKGNVAVYEGLLSEFTSGHGIVIVVYTFLSVH